MALELGPCQVKWGTAGAEEDLGKTLGGVVVRITEGSRDLKSDQAGDAPEDVVLMGASVEVECPFAEVGFTLLSKILGQDLIGAASGVVGESNVGTSLLTNGKYLVLIKYVDGIASTDLKDTITFPKAAPVPNLEFSFNSDNQRVITAVFKCFEATVNASWGGGAASDKTIRYWFGDETAVA